jgi:hypothetical protein
MVVVVARSNGRLDSRSLSYSSSLTIDGSSPSSGSTNRSGSVTTLLRFLSCPNLNTYFDLTFSCVVGESRRDSGDRPISLSSLRRLYSAYRSPAPVAADVEKCILLSRSRSCLLFRRVYRQNSGRMRLTSLHPASSMAPSSSAANYSCKCITRFIRLRSTTVVISLATSTIFSRILVPSKVFRLLISQLY